MGHQGPTTAFRGGPRGPAGRAQWEVPWASAERVLEGPAEPQEGPDRLPICIFEWLCEKMRLEKPGRPLPRGVRRGAIFGIFRTPCRPCGRVLEGRCEPRLLQIHVLYKYIGRSRCKSGVRRASEGERNASRRGVGNGARGRMPGPPPGLVIEGSAASKYPQGVLPRIYLRGLGRGIGSRSPGTRRSGGYRGECGGGIHRPAPPAGLGEPLPRPHDPPPLTYVMLMMCTRPREGNGAARAAPGGGPGVAAEGVLQGGSGGTGGRFLRPSARGGYEAVSAPAGRDLPRLGDPPPLA